jgi:hypothetical protein
MSPPAFISEEMIKKTGDGKAPAGSNPILADAKSIRTEAKSARGDTKSALLDTKPIRGEGKSEMALTGLVDDWVLYDHDDDAGEPTTIAPKASVEIGKVGEVEEVNGRLQRYLSNGPTPTERLTVDPVRALLSELEAWQDHAKRQRLFVCARRQKHLPRCLTRPDACDCDADEATAVREVKFELHSNCRASLELIVTGPLLPGHFPQCARVFALLAQPSPTLASLSTLTDPADLADLAGFETEVPLADIDPAPASFSWAGFIKPLKSTRAARLPTVGELWKVGPTKVDVYGRVRFGALAFDLSETPRYAENSITLQLDYMSFVPLSSNL